MANNSEYQLMLILASEVYSRPSGPADSSVSRVNYCHTRYNYIEFQDGIQHMYGNCSDVSTATTFWID